LFLFTFDYKVCVYHFRFEKFDLSIA